MKDDVKYPVNADLLQWLEASTAEQQRQREALERCAVALERIAAVAEKDSKPENTGKP